MKITFDNEREKLIFLSALCPDEILLENHCKNNGCEECFKVAGVVMEVKDEN